MRNKAGGKALPQLALLPIYRPQSPSSTTSMGLLVGVGGSSAPLGRARPGARVLKSPLKAEQF